MNGELVLRNNNETIATSNNMFDTFDTGDNRVKQRNTILTRALDELVNLVKTKQDTGSIVLHYSSNIKGKININTFSSEISARRCDNIDLLMKVSRVINVDPRVDISFNDKETVLQRISNLKRELLHVEQQLHFIELRENIDVLNHINIINNDYRRRL